MSVLVGISMLVYELEFEFSAEVTEPFELELELGSSMDDAMETFCVGLAAELWHRTYTVPDVEEIDVDTVMTLVFQKVGITAGQEGGMFKDVVRGWDVRSVEDGSEGGVDRVDTVVDNEMDMVGAPDISGGGEVQTGVSVDLLEADVTVIEGHSVSRDACITVLSRHIVPGATSCQTSFPLLQRPNCFSP